MSNFIVDVSHLTDDQLVFFGWVLVEKDEEFSLCWNPRYNETQPVTNAKPRYLIVDDWNDASSMSGGWDSAEEIIKGPTRQ